jgi:hypothetical protein
MVGFVGFGLSIAFGTVAYQNTNEVFDILRLTLAVPQIVFGVYIALVCISFVSLLVLLIPSFQQRAICNKNKSSKNFLLTTPFINGVGWLASTWIIFSILLTTIWCFAAIESYHASKVAIENIEPYWNRVTEFYNTTANVVARIENRSVNINDTITNVVDKVVQNNPIFTPLQDVLGNILADQYNNLLGNINETISSISSKFNQTCPIVCIDLNDVWWLEPGNNCICNLDRLESALPHIENVYNYSAVALASLFILYAGLSWMLLHTAAQYARVKMRSEETLVE